MIYAHPIGGLGNMFFHIAAIWALAKDNGDELCLINIDAKIQNLIDDKRCKLSHANEYRYFLDRFPNLNVNHINEIVQCAFTYRPIEYKKNHEYFGYFQCEKYFVHRRNEILKLFKPTDKIAESVNQYEYLFDNISLHVRRCDYIRDHPEIHIPQDMDYYNKALSLLPPDMKVAIFSDDLDWCRQNFIGDRFVFVDEIDYVSLYIMSKMKHHVIANSSFSWWGAWMSVHEDKKVIAPVRWFGENFEDASDIVPKNWIMT